MPSWLPDGPLDEILDELLDELDASEALDVPAVEPFVETAVDWVHAFAAQVADGADDGDEDLTADDLVYDLSETARTLALAAVRSLLAHRCETVRGSCPTCRGPVVLEGCGQEPEFVPNLADVGRLTKLLRRLEEEAAGERDGAADPAVDVKTAATGVTRILEQLGGLDALVRMFRGPAKEPA